MLEAHKQAEIDVRAGDIMEAESRKPFGYPPPYWAKWATISYALDQLGVRAPAEVLDLGCGAGWTSIFLAETGFGVTGLDIVPANVKTGQKRADRLKLPAKFQVGDMDKFSLPKKFDAVLIFDCLHHSIRQEKVIKQVYKHLKPGGWVLFGEPSLLHAISPEARRTTREEGVVERGITVHSLRRDSRKAGFDNFRRFFEGTQPYKSRLRGFAWQLVRLVSANAAIAPQSSLWFAAQKPKK